MMTLDAATALSASMEAEIDIFDAYVEAQAAFASSLRERDWKSFEESTNLLESLSTDLSATEAERCRAEGTLRVAIAFDRGEVGFDRNETFEASTSSEGFYRLIRSVPEPERTRLADRFRQLKICVMRTRFENQAVGDYAVANRELLGQVLEELFPEKKGRIYGRSGHAVQPGRDAILLDAAL